MQLVKKNSFLTMMITFMVVLFLLLTITDENIEKYEQITIQHGDSLWSLADQFRGKMTKQQWIQSVEKVNGLYEGKLIAGAIVKIPIEKDSIYFAQKEADYQLVKVASEN